MVSNTAIASRTGAFNGIGFAIPINLAKWVSNQLVQDGRVQRAWLGVGIRPVDRHVRRIWDLDERVKGVMVSEVRYGAPSEKGGIQPGDIITQVSGKSVNSSPELQRIVEQSPLGSSIDMNVVRDGRPMRLRVRTAALPEKDRDVIRTPRLPRGVSLLDATDYLGAYFYDLSSAESDELGLKTADSGLLVVRSSEVSQRLGLLPGAVLHQIGKKKIRDHSDLEDALENEVNSGVWRMYVELPQHSNKIVLFPAE